MNNVFEQKILGGKNTFWTPGTPDRKFFRWGVRSGGPNFFFAKIFLFKNVIHWALSGFGALKTDFEPL